VAVLDSGCTVSAGPDLLAGASGDPEVLEVDGHADPSKRVLARSAAHGTFIASLIKQLAPRAEVYVTRVLDPLGVTTEARLVDVLGRLPAETNVVSLSLGAYASELAQGREVADGRSGGTPPLLLGAVVLDLLDRDMAVVASAGNDDETMPTFPAAYPGVVGVAALQRDGSTRWDRSNRGDWVRACAVGVDLNGLFVRGDEDPFWETDDSPESWRDDPSFARWSGTSFAAPLVAATIAARLSQQPPGTLPRTVVDDVLQAAPDGPPGCGVFIDVPLPHGM
jgi:subtilisin family serine protease